MRLPLSRLWSRSLAALKSRRPRPERPRLRPLLEQLEDRLTPNAYLVNVLGDAGTTAAGVASTYNDGLHGDLRYCINRAITDGQTDTISFDPTLFAAPQTITLKSTLDTDPGNVTVFSQTAFVLSGMANITINGPTAVGAGVTIDGGNAVRLFAVEGANAALTLNNLTLSGGLATGGGGRGSGGGGLGAGGAVFDDGGSFTALGCTFTNDKAQGGAGSGYGSSGGGGLGGGNGSGVTATGAHGGGANGGATRQAGGFGGGGGGGYGGAGGAGGFGGGGGGANTGAHGGIGGFGGGGGGSGTAVGGGFGGGGGSNHFGGGGAGLGGGVFSNGGAVVLNNDTFTADSAAGGTGGNAGQGLGGAVFLLNGSLAATNDTFSLNTAADGGTDLYALGDLTDSGVKGNGQATVALNNNILGQSGTTTVADFVSNTTAGGTAASMSGANNLISDNSPTQGTGFNVTGGVITTTTDPKLGPLGNNGGPTPTMALLPTSLAIDVGSNQAATNAGLTTDQRGLTRVFNSTVDLGAYEAEFHTYTVNVLGDSSGSTAGTSTGAYSGDLRYCINAAVADHGYDTINFDTTDPNEFQTARTITLDKTLDSDPTNFRVFSQTAFVLQGGSITINGPAAGVTIDGGNTANSSANAVRLFAVEGANTSLTLNYLTLSGGLATGGSASGNGGGGLGAGGAVFDDGGSFTATGCTFTNDQAKGGAGSAGANGAGGGLGGGSGTSASAIGNHGGGANGGAVRHAGGFGGGGGAGSVGTAGVGGFGGGGGGAGSGAKTGGVGGFGGGGGAGGTAAAGGVGGFGGGGGAGVIGGSGAGLGGGVFSNGGTLVLNNDTFTADSAAGGTRINSNQGQGLGGAVFLLNGSLAATNDTFSLNTADDGGTDVYVLSDKNDSGVKGTGTATVTLNNDILGQSGTTTVSDFVANITAGGSAPMQSGGNDLISDNPGTGGFTGGVVSATDPKLNGLAANGGPTETMAESANSPTVDAGSDAAATAAVLTTDQRGPGFARIANGRVDLGAFEVQSSLVPGSVVSQGSSGAGEQNVPSGQNFIAVAARDYFGLALKADGTVAAWGDNDSGQTSVPPTLSGVIAVAAGGHHALALKNDGTVVAWGNDGSGQTTIPTAATNVVAIAAGEAFSLALKSDGTVVAWGDNGAGQLGVPGGLSGVIAIAAGTYHALALKSDGTVVAWGDNDCGQTTVPGGLSGVTAIAAGERFSMALKTDGTVAAWGNNGSGQITVPGGLSGVTAIAAGAYHALALKSDGTVVGWGNNQFGQASLPGQLSGVEGIAAGSFFSLSLQAPQHLDAAGGEGPGGAADLSAAQLQDAVAAALTQLQLAGVDAALIQSLAAAHYGVGSLPSGVLGLTDAANRDVTLSADAAGYGWSADPAVPPASGREDLLTAVLHEMGHLAGRPDTDAAGLMDGLLAPGVRDIGALDQVFAGL